MKSKIFLILCMVLIVSPIAFAITSPQETSSVSRIVGESPTEMLKQLQKNELALNHATYYTTDIISDKDNILKEQFNNNVEYNNLFWNFNDVQNSARSFNKNELFILESEGSPSKLKKGSEELSPKDVLSWQLEGKDSLVILDAPYSGIYLPKEDTFVSRLTRESAIIAPSSFNSQEFTKSLLCQLADDKTLGEVFKDARNFHYNGGSKSSQDNYIGLVLQSYSLYGNPREKIDMDWTEADKERIKRNYCKNYLENLAPNIEFLEESGKYSKFRKHLLFEIPSHTITQVGDFSILSTENAFQNLEPNEIVEPIAVRKTHFPINTIITNYNLDSVENPVELEIQNLPSYMNRFVQRTCYEESRNYKVEFENAYTKDNLEFIARIYPMEIISCEEGKVKLYTKFSYSIDYIPLSPVLINKISSPSSSPVKKSIDLDLEIMPLTNSIATGTLAIFDQDNNIVWEQEISTENTGYKATILAPEQEGSHKYSVEFMQNNETLNYKEFSIETIILTPKAKIPITARDEEQIEINYESQFDQSFELETKYYLLHNFDIVQEGSSKKTINLGENIDLISLNNLKKEDKSYTLTLELSYLGNKKTISYLLNTNNIPFSYIEVEPSYQESEKIIIPYELVDIDNDPIELIIEDSRFSKEDNTLVWQTNGGDFGEYPIKYKVSDGIDQIEKYFTVKIVEAPDFDGDSYKSIIDCDDKNASINPIAVEICNGIDDNCNGNIDENLVSNWVCAEWPVDCANGIKKRTCTDINSCNIENRIEEESCEVQQPVEEPVQEAPRDQEQLPKEENSIVPPETVVEEPEIEIPVIEPTPEQPQQEELITEPPIVIEEPTPAEPETPTEELPVIEPVIEEPIIETPPEQEVPVETPKEEILIENPENHPEKVPEEVSTIKPVAPEIIELVESMKETLVTNIQEISIIIEEPIQVEGSENKIQEEKMLVIKEGTEPLIELPVNDDTPSIEIQNLAITKQEENADKGFVVISGLVLPKEITKTIYVDIKDLEATGVCIKDAEIGSISEVSSDCSGENEIFLQCNNEEYNKYKCEKLESKYKITGLKHSAVIESSIITDLDDDGYPNTVDCKDRDPTVYPGKTETCNSKDDNCNPEVDEGLIGVETCTEWSSIDYKGEACGDRKCETCGNSVVVTIREDCESAPCIPREETCEPWPNKGYYGEECGNQICTDGCRTTKINKKDCSVYQDVCTWSDKNGCDDGCGIETCVKINGETYQREKRNCKDEITTYTIETNYGIESCHKRIDLCGRGRGTEEVNCEIFCPYLAGEWPDTGLEGPCGKRIIYNKCDPNLIRNTEEKECVIGDIDNNECIRFEDFFLLVDCINGEYQEKCDLNKDSIVDEKDLNIVTKWMGKGICKIEEPVQKPVITSIIEISGDLNKDLCVDYDDLFMLTDNIGPDYNEIFDLNKDNRINKIDSNIIYNNFGKGCEWENQTKKRRPKPTDREGLVTTSSKAGGRRENNENPRVRTTPQKGQHNNETNTAATALEPQLENVAAKPVNIVTEIPSCNPQIICSNWEKKDSRGDCGEQICTNGCGIEWKNFKACRGIVETVQISLCSERTICYSWSSTDSNNEGCGEQLCTNSCGNRWLNNKECIGGSLNKKETVSCREHISCYQWTTADNLVEGCGWQKCVNNCGGEFFNRQNCNEHNIGKDTNLCASKIICSQWSSSEDTGEGCGIQACKDNCRGEWFNYKKCSKSNKANQFSSCSLSITCSKWSDKGYISEGCGEQRCKDGCGFEWSNHKSCSKLDQTVIIDSCIPNVTCSEWSSRGYIGETCGEQRCNNGCGIEWSNYVDCREKKELPPSETQCASEITCSPYLFEDNYGYCGPKTCIDNCGGAWSSTYGGCDVSGKYKIESCTQEPTCSTWSNSNKSCGERKCIDNCGFEWTSNTQCS